MIGLIYSPRGFVHTKFSRFPQLRVVLLVVKPVNAEEASKNHR